MSVEMRTVSIKLPVWMINEMDDLILKGYFLNRSEFIRFAIRLTLKLYEENKNKLTIRYRGDIYDSKDQDE